MKKKTKHYWDAIDPIWDSISIDDGPRVFLKQFRAVDSWRANLFAAHWCQSEVCNGGFLQFFENSTGVLAPEARAAFEEIGLPRMANIVRKAIAFFEGEFPRSRSARNRILNAYQKKHPQDPDPFDALNGDFYKYVDDFEERADQYAAEYF